MEYKGLSLVRKDTAVIENKEKDDKQVQVKVDILERRKIIKLNKFDQKFYNNRKMLTDSIEE